MVDIPVFNMASAGIVRLLLCCSGCEGVISSSLLIDLFVAAGKRVTFSNLVYVLCAAYGQLYMHLYLINMNYLFTSPRLAATCVRFMSAMLSFLPVSCWPG